MLHLYQDTQCSSAYRPSWKGQPFRQQADVYWQTLQKYKDKLNVSDIHRYKRNMPVWCFSWLSQRTRLLGMNYNRQWLGKTVLHKTEKLLSLSWKEALKMTPTISRPTKATKSVAVLSSVADVPRLVFFRCFLFLTYCYIHWRLLNPTWSCWKGPSEIQVSKLLEQSSQYAGRISFLPLRQFFDSTSGAEFRYTLYCSDS